MPSYRYGCSFDNTTIEEHRPIADRGRLPLCPTCGAPMQRVYTMPFISASLTPTSRPDAAAALSRERGWEPDMKAFKRLSEDGMYPAHIDGSAELEARANTKTEIEMGKVMKKQDVIDGVDLSSHMMQKDLEV